MTSRIIGCSQDQWCIIEEKFNEAYLGKSEVLMALGNGYLGVRATTEENYYGEKRNMFIAGTFNKADDNEVTELPNYPDIIQISLTINGQKFSLSDGVVHKYEKRLNLKTGELIREIIWSSEKSGQLSLRFSRFVSQDDHHLIGQKVTVIPLEKDVTLFIESGIDGQVTNSGAQHFVEGERRFFDHIVMSLTQRTCESHIESVVLTGHKISLNQQETKHNVLIKMDRRKIYGEFRHELKMNSTYEFIKYSMIGTSRDVEYEDFVIDSIQSDLMSQLKSTLNHSYDTLLKNSADLVNRDLWNQSSISIQSNEVMDQFSVRFAQYHLYSMTAKGDPRMGIGAKGLTGEGYKGHSFWDTEAFIFPYYMYTQPSVARQLLIYRYLTLDGARCKAGENGYEGAMFPWESAWSDDGEVTPVLGAADIISGEATKIWSGFIELHITADIAFAIYQYDNLTEDDEFMRQCGYEMIFETAKFWSSRLEKEEDGFYHINNVIGADEYKEHVDDNAFTNYLVHLNFELALTLANRLTEKDQDTYLRLSEKYDFEDLVLKWEDGMNNLYLPQPNEDGVLPQDATYLTKQVIDLSKYKTQKSVGGIFDDYNMGQITNMQVSKQADVIMLFYLRENLFSDEVKRANWHYYEPKTLHDSSLSLSTHAIIANDIGDYDLSYKLFRECCDIDLGTNMNSSNHGIHAASLGGMIQCVMNGFGGVRVLDGLLRIEPNLPSNWHRLSFPLFWHGDKLMITVTDKTLVVENETRINGIIEFSAFGANYLLTEKTTIQL